MQLIDVSANDRKGSISQKTITEAVSSLKSKFLKIWQDKLNDRIVKSDYREELFLDELYNCNENRARSFKA